MTSESIDNALREVNGLLSEGNAQAAAQKLDALIARNPDNDALLYARMLVYAQAGQLDEAFTIAVQMSDAAKQPWLVSFQILKIATGLKRLDVNDATERELCRLLEYRGIFCQPISELVYRFFLARVEQARQTGNWVAACNEIAIINTVLRRFPLKFKDTEIVVTGLRRKLLLHCSQEPGRFEDASRLAASIAIQGHHNEYAFFVDDEETAILARFEHALRSEAASAAQVLALLMYRSPTALREAIGLNGLACPHLEPEMQRFVADDLAQADTVRRYAKEFAAGMSTSNHTSATVAQMYIENPYPRWIEAETNANFRSLQYPEFYRVVDSPAWDASSGLKFDNILVAGCGTGWHPISRAMTFPWIEITAIDLSPVSLAYARMMAEKLGVRNVRFEQGDLLDLGDRFGTFNVVECIGTLHHLKDPDAGLRQLLRHLDPGGILRLGYYSKLARQPIARFREDHPANDEDVDDEFIRKLRHRFFVDDSFAPYRDVMTFSDFYSISGCRDLILHPQETQYTIRDLQRILAEHGLGFLTFSPTDIGRFEQLGGQGSPYELGNWEAVEEKEPRLFSSMYQFFTQYRR